jgi:hypothetical protein
MIAQEWALVLMVDSLMEIWQNKIRHLCNFLRGWARNQCSKYKLEKERLSNLIDFLDCKAEVTPLNAHEIEESRGHPFEFS